MTLLLSTFKALLKSSRVRALIAIGLGAIAGALCRYYIGQWLGHTIASTWSVELPIETVIINISGCFLMGVLTTLIANGLALNPEITLLLATGFLGSYTTFSTYELDTMNLLSAGEIRRAFLYWIGSPILGVCCFGIGSVMIRLVYFPQNNHDA